MANWIPKRRSQWEALWQTREEALLVWWEWRGRKYRLHVADYRDMK